jgi:hypothetical protein
MAGEEFGEEVLMDGDAAIAQHRHLLLVIVYADHGVTNLCETHGCY